jgi:hypothetical protein
MARKPTIADLQRTQELGERRRAEAETEEDYLQDGQPSKSSKGPVPQSHASASDPSPKVAKGDRIHTSIYLPRDLRRRLREIAAAEDCKVHDLILKGVRHVIDRRLGRG